VRVCRVVVNGMATCDLMRLTNGSTRLGPRPFDKLFLDRRVLIISSDALLTYNIGETGEPSIPDSLSHNHNHPNFFFSDSNQAARQEPAPDFVVKRRLQTTTVLNPIYPTRTYYWLSVAPQPRNLSVITFSEKSNMVPSLWRCQSSSSYALQ
jgi:hypothetical protein